MNVKSVPYVGSQKKRDVKRGLIRIGTTFKLREDFYSAMWIYLHKVDYILGIDPYKTENDAKTEENSKTEEDANVVGIRDSINSDSL